MVMLLGQTTAGLVYVSDGIGVGEFVLNGLMLHVVLVDGFDSMRVVACACVLFRRAEFIRSGGAR